MNFDLSRGHVTAAVVSLVPRPLQEILSTAGTGLGTAFKIGQLSTLSY